MLRGEVMRQGIMVAAVLGVLQLVGLTRAQSEPAGFFEAQREFEGGLQPQLRQVLQVWLIGAGYSNAVPNERFSTRTFKAIQQFQAVNGYLPDGRLDKAQVERLIAIIDPKFAQWGLRRVALPGHAAALWVPFSLGLDVRATDKGMRYEDRQGRFKLGFFALPNISARGALQALIEKEVAQGTTIHFKALKDDWFALSTTRVDGTDHYYRYHQDGSTLVGFAMDWNNAVGDVNVERIAVLNSAVLAASMAGEPFIDPPRPAPAQVEAKLEVAPPRAPEPAPSAPPPPLKKEGFSTGTGFFVSDDGAFVTNAHVVAGCTAVMVKTDDGQVREASHVATDATNDLAILRVPGTPKRVAPLRIGSRLGEGVEAFGFPHTDVLASSGNFTLGNVTALQGLRDDSRYLQVSVPVQAGNSGGPLLDGSGNVVGVVSAKLDAVKMAMASGDLPQNVNFAVKSAILATFLDANRVTYAVGVAGGKAMEPADIADAARAMSGFVVCR